MGGEKNDYSIIFILLIIAEQELLHGKRLVVRVQTEYTVYLLRCPRNA